MTKGHFVYHFYGFTQITLDEVRHIDGTHVSDFRINSSERYQRARESIAKTAGIEPEKLTLANLTLIS